VQTIVFVNDVITSNHIRLSTALTYAEKKEKQQTLFLSVGEKLEK
jgi:hypothetical protein